MGFHGLVAALRRAKHPALVVGPAAAVRSNVSAFCRFAEAHANSVFTTMEAVSAFPQEHHLSRASSARPAIRRRTRSSTKKPIRSSSWVRTWARWCEDRSRKASSARRPSSFDSDPAEAARALPARLVVRGESEAIFKKLLEAHRHEHFSWRASVPELARFAPVLLQANRTTRGSSRARPSTSSIVICRGVHVVVDAGNCARLRSTA
jgi:thiamine pyrophosphate-dependent acetolactate synthase large subunit-like protein